MPLGKQAAAYTLASSFPDSCGKVQDAPPNPFSVFFPPALSIGFAFINTTPTFCKRSGSFVFPSHSRLGGEQGRPSVKIRRCITGETALVEGKISCALRVVPPLLRAVWESPWGSDFHAIWNIKHCSHLFSSVGAFVFPIPSGIGGRTGPPRCKNAPVHNGRVTLAGRKIFRAFQIVPPSLRAVWESLWGLNFHEIRNIKHCSHLFSLRRGRE